MLSRRRLCIAALSTFALAAGCSGSNGATVMGDIAGPPKSDGDEHTQDDDTRDDGSGRSDAGKRDGGKGDGAADVASPDGGKSDAAKIDGAAPSSGSLPAAVGFIIQSINGSAYPICVATLIGPTRVATLYRCIATDFTGPGGQTATGTNYFALAADVDDPNAWEKITVATKYEFLAMAELEHAVSGVTPAKLPSGPLASSDVGQTFVTARFTGRDVNGNVPTGASRQLVGDTTVVKAITGQPMHSVFASYDAFIDAITDLSYARADYKSEGQYAKYGPAQIYQRPLLGKYELFAKGNNETAMAGESIDTRGAPLLRALAGGDYEIVGVYREAVEAYEQSVTPYVLGSYYAALPTDTIAMLKGAGQNGVHCGDVQVDLGQCRNGFALNCGVFGGEIIDIATSNSYFCGEPSQCRVRAFATDPNKKFAECL